MNKSNLILAGSGYLGESIIAEYNIIKNTFNIVCLLVVVSLLVKSIGYLI